MEKFWRERKEKGALSNSLAFAGSAIQFALDPDVLPFTPGF